MAHLCDETRDAVLASTGTTATGEQIEKAMTAILKTRAVIFGQVSNGTAKVAIESDSYKVLIYRFHTAEHCPCKAGKHTRNCWHAITPDLPVCQQIIDNRDNAAKQQAAKARIARPIAVAAGGNALDALFNLNLPGNNEAT